MIEIVPAIDIIGGKCVRLTRGDFSRRRNYGDPLEMARQFADHGLTRLHLVDLDGARQNRVVNHRILERISRSTGLVIDAGGGLRSREDLKTVFDAGASMATGGSVAVKEREEFLGWLKEFGPEKIILGADVRDRRIAVSGWKEDTSLEIISFLDSYVKEGITRVICTDIGKDGMLEGPSVDLYREIKKEHPSIFLVASGGIGSMDDIRELDDAGIDGVIVGKAIYEKRIPLGELGRYIRNRD